MINLFTLPLHTYHNRNILELYEHCQFYGIVKSSDIIKISQIIHIIVHMNFISTHIYNDDTLMSTVYAFIFNMLLSIIQG